MIRLASVHDYQSIKTFDPFSGSRKEDVKDQRVFVCLQDGQVSGIALRLISHIESRYTNKRLFISTESSNNIMQELLLKLAYVPAGEISGANLNGTKELFYYKDENA